MFSRNALPARAQPLTSFHHGGVITLVDNLELRGTELAATAPRASQERRRRPDTQVMSVTGPAAKKHKPLGDRKNLCLSAKIRLNVNCSSPGPCANRPLA